MARSTTKINKTKAYGIIMAGGSGTRFWPLSRKALPKQLLALSGEESLITMTARRFEGLIPMENVFVFTSKDQVQAMCDELFPIGVNPENVIGEPVRCDTAACVGYAATIIRRKFRDGVCVVLPADHYIESTDKFQETIKTAVEVAERKPRMVVIGVTPDKPATGFGYVKRGKPFRSREGVYHVEKFTEKPDAETAAAFVESGDYYWNCGMFVWRASSILGAIESHMPKLHRGLGAIYDALDTEDSDKSVEAQFRKFDRISIDYGVMEKVEEDVYVVEASFEWDDVGSWRALERHFPHNEADNVFRGDVVAMGSAGCTVLSEGEHMVGLVGCQDIIVVHTKDATLVVPKHDAEKVKELVEKLADENRTELL